MTVRKKNILKQHAAAAFKCGKFMVAKKPFSKMS